MAYNPNIPQALDLISVSQGDILNNFGQANTIFAVDHVAFDALSNNGKHNKSSMLDQTGSIPTSLANEAVIYNVTTAGISSLRYVRDTLTTQFTLNPIKAFAVVEFFGGAEPSTQILVDSFNITTASRTGNNVTFTISNPMRTSNSYAIFFSTPTAGVGLSTTTFNSTTSFTLGLNGFNAAGQRFNVFVMET